MPERGCEAINCRKGHQKALFVYLMIPLMFEKDSSRVKTYVRVCACVCVCTIAQMAFVLNGRCQVVSMEKGGSHK